MIPFLTRLVILVVAGYALYRLWRDHRSTDRWINIPIAVGFLARAVIGQLMFWISYARLPVARQLQMGDGLWFFARDALEYFPAATKLARSGVVAIINYPTSGASVAFVKVLAVAVLLLGSVTSVALLLNLFCYLGTMAVIVRWSEHETRARTAALLAICAISLSPAFFLWSLQPLKDTFFQFTVIAFIGACAAWQRLWRATRVRMSAVIVTGLAMTITLLAIAGIRWYFAFAVFVASTMFVLLVASTSQARKTISFGAMAVLIVLLSRAFLLGGGPYVPPAIVGVLTPSTAFAEARDLPSSIISRIESVRDGFDKAGGRTSISAGGRLSKLDEALPKAAAPKTPPAKAASAATPATHKEETDAQLVKAPPQVVSKTTVVPAPAVPKHEHPAQTVSKTPADPLAAPPTGETASPSAPMASASVPETSPKPTNVAVTTSSAPAAPEVSRPIPQPSVSALAATATATPLSASPSSAAHPAGVHGSTTPVPAPQSVSIRPAADKAPSRTKRPPRSTAKTVAAKPVTTTAAPAVIPPPAKVTAVANPAPVRAVPQQPDAELRKPASTTTRLLTGMASMVVPRSVGERLGLFHIGGGQGMFWFTELDTFIFDVVVLGAIAALALRRSASWRNPLVWFLTLLTLLAGIPLSYAITNYGTLFRLREMIYIGLALTPLALATSSWREKTAVPDASPAALTQ